MPIVGKPKKEHRRPSDVGDAYRGLEAEKRLIEEELVRCKKEVYDTQIQVEIDVQKRTKELESEIARLKEIARSKDEFIRVTNHELRTPLDIIRGNVDMILKGETGEIAESTREYLVDVLMGADRLTKLVNDMLDIARIEAGRMEFKLEDVDSENVLTTVIKEFRPVMEKMGLNIELNLPSELPKIFSDRSRIFQILDNLIGNSLKFTPEGGVIYLKARPEKDSVVISVQDTGMGIRPEDREKLFKKFPQIDSGSVQVGKGTGLGLNLVWQMVHKLGGRIWVDSEGSGKGATFSFELPRSGTGRASALQRFHDALNVSRG